ncbi:MAG: oxidoreductase [Gammaproteobacteria bacterium TMED78]|nr:MAG: oxidoreductase [Gammaproteobacteria bacterium TMED78]
MSNNYEKIGLAIIGCGTIGRIRSSIARDYPGVEWIGLCDLDKSLGKKLAKDIKADYFTTDMEDLLSRPEVNSVMILTDENHHTDPTLLAIEHNHRIFVEKPLATDISESLDIVNALEKNKVDACVGYTQRFRRRFLAIKERISNGQIGNVHSVITRALMNRMVPIATISKTKNRNNLTPMVVSGTHSLDMSMWLMEGKRPVSVYAKSTDQVLSALGTKDSTFGLFTMDDGTIFSMNISWCLPSVWPGSVYGLEIGIVGTKGVIDVEDTHRDLILATEESLPAGYTTNDFQPPMERHVDFLTSYPPGDIWNQQFWGPMKEETISWFTRILYNTDTPHATAKEGHRNLILTMAMDKSARIGKEIELPEDLSLFE